VSELQSYAQALARAPLARRIGWVRRVHGLAIEADGPELAFGEMCHVHPGDAGGGIPVLAEVVGLEPGRVLLMPYGPVRGVGEGARVEALGHAPQVAVGPALIGRVLDAFGQPLDGRERPQATAAWPLHGVPPNPMTRPPIAKVLQTGVRVIDGLLTLGEGQRIGIFAGSGVGKSSLLGTITRGARADVHVIALIGERSREVREFVEDQLGAEGLARSVVVAATSEQPALARIRAAHAAVAIATWFAGQGRSVLLTMDSITRLAMARREVGLAAGEPATARGYTPSAFAELPQLCERCGTFAGGGSVSALFTVLVEGDDLNEPVADHMRAILDGHIVLSRELAQQGHYPAIDVLRSASRVMSRLASDEERQLAADAVRHLAVLEKNRQLVDLGAYAKGTNAALDAALAREAALSAWLRQDGAGVGREEALRALSRVLANGVAG
jgi:flagellum-specific ATP synthase